VIPHRAPGPGGTRSLTPIRVSAAIVFPLAALVASAASAQRSEIVNDTAEKLVQLDFADTELSAVIDNIARLTGRNFIYDDRVRGRVTIVSPSRVTVEQAYAVFESVLQVKGFTTVDGPGGVTKIIPVREAKESSIETVRDDRPSPNRDHFVTRLIPLRYIDAQDISNTLKPLVSKDAAMVAYAPTNTIILTDSSSNIRRLLTILEAIDVESYREELAVIPVEIYGAELSATTGATSPRRSRRAARAAAQAAAGGPQLAPGIEVRILTDERTNSLLVLAPRAQIEDVRELVRKLDVEVTGRGRINVYYLKHADAEELAQTLNSLLSGQTSQPSVGQTGAAAGAPQALRSAVTELAEGITLTADPGTNSLVIQASKEAYDTLVRVIEKLDIQRPQVLVEALIMEVNVTDSLELGFNWTASFAEGDFTVASVTRAIGEGAMEGAMNGMGMPSATSGITLRARSTFTPNSDTTIQTILTMSATDNSTNVISAPHILTSDNEEAEIRIGNNIPIITGRTNSPTGDTGLSQSVNVERQDIGVTLRVTPQISEGDTLRLNIFQEISDVTDSLSVGDPNEVGVALTNRRVENTVVVADGETVVIGGLISDDVDETETKVPWLGDIPFLGWAFKSTSESETKQNLLVFLTPHIVRSAADLERRSIEKREEFGESAGKGLELSREEREEAEAQGIDLAAYRGGNPVRATIIDHRERYPIERMKELEAQSPDSRAGTATIQPGVRYSLRAGVYSDEEAATRALTEVVDAGYDGTLVSSVVDGAVIYEIRVGPYESFDSARTAQALLRGSFGMEPTVTVLPAENE